MPAVVVGPVLTLGNRVSGGGLGARCLGHPPSTPALPTRCLLIADPKAADYDPVAFPLRHCAPPPPEPGEEKKERERETQARFFLKNAIVRSQAILACASL